MLQIGRMRSHYSINTGLQPGDPHSIQTSNGFNHFPPAIHVPIEKEKILLNRNVPV